MAERKLRINTSFGRCYVYEAKYHFQYMVCPPIYRRHIMQLVGGKKPQVSDLLISAFAQSKKWNHLVRPEAILWL